MKKWLIILAFLPFHLLSQFPNHNWNDCPKNDIAHDQDFMTWSGASVDEKIGRLNFNTNHDTISFIVYSEIADTANLFGINGDSVYFTSVTGLQKSKIYWVQFKVTDGLISDTASAYIYIADADSLIHWNDKYDYFDEGYYYYFNRGLVYELDNTIDIDNDNVTFMAIGNGAYPRLLCNVSSGDDLSQFDISSDNFHIRDIQYETNNNYRVSRLLQCYDYVDDFITDNCRFIGTDDYKLGFTWRYDRSVMGYNHKVMNCYVEYSQYENATYMNMSGIEWIANVFTYQGCDWDTYYESPCVCEMIHSLETYPHYYYDIRYNYSVNLANADDIVSRDTIMNNWFIGPGVLNGDLNWTYSGMFICSDSVYVAYNKIDSCEVGLGFQQLVSYHRYATIENNIFNGCRRFGILVFDGVTQYLKLRHNTFTDPASDDEYYVIGGGLSSTDTIANNIFDISDGQNVFQTLDAVRMYNIYTDTTGTNYIKTATEIVGNPLFTDKAGGDLTLQSGSPAINAGYNFGVVYDFAGNVRDATPDIGAYEYQTETEPESTTVTYKGTINLNDATINGQEISTIKYRGISYKE